MTAKQQRGRAQKSTGETKSLKHKAMSGKKDYPAGYHCSSFVSMEQLRRAKQCRSKSATRRLARLKNCDR
jgi:hypothetical protein